MKHKTIYCPTCTALLNRVDVVDIFRTAYKCENGHRYYVVTNQPNAEESKQAPKIKSPTHPNSTDPEIIRFWLTDESARSTLNISLALMISRILEVIESEINIPKDTTKFEYCTLCKGSLVGFDQDDCWVRGIKCHNDHKFYERGGTVHYHIDSEIQYLSEEMNDSVLDFQTEGWLKNNPVLECNLHPEIKGIIRRYRIDYL